MGQVVIKGLINNACDLIVFLSMCRHGLYAASIYALVVLHALSSGETQVCFDL